MNMIVISGKGRDFADALKELLIAVEVGCVIYFGAKTLSGETIVKRAEKHGRNIGDLTIRDIQPGESAGVYHFSNIFDWGNWSASATQLSLALLYDATGDKEAAYRHCKDFTDRLVSTWGVRWSIHREQINRWLSLWESKQNGGAHD